jgi:predicted Co/Zn/Cd cation transporter (cation efflux family)
VRRGAIGVDSERKTTSLSERISIGFFVCALVAMGLALALLVVAIPADSLAVTIDGAASMVPLYFAVMAFLISVLIKPSRPRLLWFGGFGFIYSALLFFDLAKGAHTRLI